MDLDSALTGKPAEGATATDLLRADHREVRGLFAEYERAHGAEHARNAIAQTLAMQLELHDMVEREVFYPAVQAIVEQLVESAMREHDEIARLVEDVKHHLDERRRCEEIVEALRSAVEEHVREEEQSLFPQVEKAGGAELRALGAAIVRRKEELTRSTEAFEGPAT